VHDSDVAKPEGLKEHAQFRDAAQGGGFRLLVVWAPVLVLRGRILS
jgi:hypothetical protein